MTLPASSTPAAKATNGTGEHVKEDGAPKKIVRPFEDKDVEDEPKPKKVKIEGEHTRLKQLLSGEMPARKEQILNGVKKEDKKDVSTEDKVGVTKKKCSRLA